MPRERAQISASLQTKGFTLTVGDDHDFLVFSHAGLTRAVFTKLSRGTAYREYSDKLLGEMCRQLQITRGQLNRLIDCPMDGPEYVGVLLDRGIIVHRPRDGSAATPPNNKRGGSKKPTKGK
jgi:hypothetical protein